MQAAVTLNPIGVIRKTDEGARIEIDPAYQAAMDGLALFSHIQVLYWLNQNDNPQGRGVLKVHPCANPENPLVGIFATHSPMRPNPIALTRCRILKIEDCTIYVEDIDAFDNSPLIDIKSYFPPSEHPGDIKVPNWNLKPRAQPSGAKPPTA